MWYCHIIQNEPLIIDKKWSIEPSLSFYMYNGMKKCKLNIYFMTKKLTLKRKIPLKFYIILLVCIPFANHAQSVKRQCISSYGAIATYDSTTFEQTVGQPYNTTASYESNTSVLQGFQQPVVFKVENINSVYIKGMDINIYPNPANYSITIQSKDSIENSLIQVMDMNGKLIMSDRITLPQTYNISCDAWENGTYIITISDINLNKSSLKLIINK